MSQVPCIVLKNVKGLGVNRKAKKYKMELSVLGATWVRCLHPYIEPKSQLAPKSDKVWPRKSSNTNRNKSKASRFCSYSNKIFPPVDILLISRLDVEYSLTLKISPGYGAKNRRHCRALFSHFFLTFFSLFSLFSLFLVFFHFVSLIMTLFLKGC